MESILWRDAFIVVLPIEKTTRHESMISIVG